jgi:hypothetical protein
MPKFDDGNTTGSDIVFLDRPNPELFLRDMLESRRQRKILQFTMKPGSRWLRVLGGSGQGSGGVLPDSVHRFAGAGSSGDAATSDLTDSTDLFTAISRSDLKRFGLNSTKAWEIEPSTGRGGSQATLFGVDGASLEDCSRLGARVVRQHGGRNLYWPQLAPNADADSMRNVLAGADVPLEGELTTALHDGLDENGSFEVEDGTLSVSTMGNVERLGWLLAKARLNGIKVVFTFLTQGGGEAGTTSTPDLSRCNDSENAPHVDGTQRLGTGSQFVPLVWSAEHYDQPSPSGEYTFPSNEEAVGDCAWNFESLDPACPYKREYIGLIATEVGNLLARVLTWLRARSVLTASEGLADVIEAIELFNEVDVRDQWLDGSSPDPGRTGINWGRAYLHGAWALRQIPELDDVPLWLPGIAEYAEDLVSDTWRAKLLFAKGLIEGMVSEANERTTAVGAVAASDIFDVFHTLAQGIDLHWYHRNELRHICHLVHEVAELQQAIHEGVRSQLDASYAPVIAEFRDFPVTVLETGHATTDDCPDGIDGDTFQAWEVWRRLGGALASNARVVGWHSWMARYGTTFQLTGLRDDSSSAGSAAFHAEQRKSWFAYQGLAHLLGDRIVSGRVVLPRTSGRSALEALLASYDPRVEDPYVVVFEFVVLRGSRVEYAYLVFRDPTDSRPEGDRLVGLVGWPTSSVDEYAPEPDRTQLVSAGSEHRQPVRRSHWSPATTCSGLGHFRLVDWEPRLYFSPRPIEWEFVSAMPAEAEQRVLEALYGEDGTLEVPWFGPLGS